MTIDPQELERLAQDLEVDAVQHFEPAVNALTDIADKLRTGQLVPAMPSGDEVEAVARKFNLGDRVTKTKGSSWTGLVVGFYSTSLTPIGYAVESENEPGSVQIYPESALDAVRGKQACLKARENGDG